MRCPYCHALNPERASFCAQCGRDLPSPQAREQSPYLPAPRPGPTHTTQGATRANPPYQQPRPPQPATVPRQAPVPPPRVPVPVPVPQSPPPLQQVVEPPAQFPPRTVAQLKELQAEAVPYTVVDDSLAAGQKKIIRIVYRRCAAWQQVATLLKAFNEQKPTETLNTVIVQGVLEQDTTPYLFTNGQLQFDRSVRLGSQTLNRFQIETGNGLENDSVRIVLSE